MFWLPAMSGALLSADNLPSFAVTKAKPRLTGALLKEPPDSAKQK